MFANDTFMNLMESGPISVDEARRRSRIGDAPPGGWKASDRIIQQPRQTVASPQVGDILFKIVGSRISVMKVQSNMRAKEVAHSYTFQRQRVLQIGSDSKDAKDFTKRNIEKKGRALLRKHIPHLLLRDPTLWIWPQGGTHYRPLEPGRVAPPVAPPAGTPTKGSSGSSSGQVAGMSKKRRSLTVSLFRGGQNTDFTYTTGDEWLLWTSNSTPMIRVRILGVARKKKQLRVASDSVAHRGGEWVEPGMLYPLDTKVTPKFLGLTPAQVFVFGQAQQRIRKWAKAETDLGSRVIQAHWTAPEFLEVFEDWAYAQGWDQGFKGRAETPIHQMGSFYELAQHLGVVDKLSKSLADGYREGIQDADPLSAALG